MKCLPGNNANRPATKSFLTNSKVIINKKSHKHCKAHLIYYITLKWQKLAFEMALS